MNTIVTEEKGDAVEKSGEGDLDIAKFKAMNTVNECWRTAISMLLGMATAMLALPVIVVASMKQNAPPLLQSLLTGGVWWFAVMSWLLLLFSLAAGLYYLHASAKGARRAASLELSKPWDRMSFQDYESRLDRSYRSCVTTTVLGAACGIIFGLTVTLVMAC